MIQVTDEPDAGPILSQESLEIGDDENFGALVPRLAELAANAVLPAITRTLRSKNPKSQPQNEKAASQAPRFDRRHRRAPWWLTADVVAQRLRALSPEPGMTTLVKRRRVRILQASQADYFGGTAGDGGTFIGLRSGQMLVRCGQGTVLGIRRLQLADGETMSASRFVRAERLTAGDVLI